MIVKCSGENCEATLAIDMPLHPDFRYTCKDHTGKAPNEVRFQDFQFDSSIDRGERVIAGDSNSEYDDADNNHRVRGVSFNTPKS